MSVSNPIIPIKAYRFHFDVDSPVNLPRFPGSAWRGAFGHALKKTVCVVRNTPCNQCLLKNACAYSYVFETPPSANAEKMRKYTAAPHPFVLQFPQTAARSGYELDIILFGHGQRYFPYFIHALQTAGRSGIGGHQQLFNLQKVDDISLTGHYLTIYENGELKPQPAPEQPLIPDMPVKIAITFHTPLRIKQDNKNLVSRQFTFSAFFSTLLRRISMISYFHTDTLLETDFAGLSGQAKTVEFNQQNLQWFDWTRYSSRQQTEMSMGGLIGTVELDMHNLEAFWPYLWLGQWTHVGKGTSMGMGAYSIKAASLPATSFTN
ncbi:MAG: CRISPR system precrRNA processing endoribonuclease RAMP protein Cas6 [Methylicorpusculum sp.]|uniref:CRISPR system precrRNA processing endoribonuclease RAMP protein Cas6 n=1 Tax=Methylicorpusculum sp. TaxID=2713644 RepID=UPI0027277772|nr:CRISPR system precrRNA processing endoribonuclease RAMP protein Cas6 [Methylicorpusculum sp.]MDO8940711.1 CRISPR system precrRNA processing endoribonuclease RAMP protein Cas6 [Methylicorpusculum sp.]MDP2203770.1 CRISPR system precrRNA processing endoribonuclease RAMP protein Cas6 [Methylicorpusculum sp.]